MIQKKTVTAPAISINQNCSNCKSHFEQFNQTALCSAHQDLTVLFEKVKISVHFKTHQVLFEQDQELLGLYTVSDGLVKLETVHQNGQLHTLRYVGPGQAIGFNSIINSDKSHFSAITLQPTTVCFIPKATILESLKLYPELGLSLLKTLTQDLKLAENKWTDQLTKDVSIRVAEALIYLQTHFQDHKWTRKEIAEWAGTTPESVIRTLAHFEKEKWIDQSEGRNIKIIEKEKLQILISQN